MNEYNNLIKETLDDHGVVYDSKILFRLNNLPIDVLAKEVQSLIDSKELNNR